MMCNRRGAYAAQGGKGTVQGFGDLLKGMCYAHSNGEKRKCQGFSSNFYGFMVFLHIIQKSMVNFVYFVEKWLYGKMSLYGVLRASNGVLWLYGIGIRQRG